MNATKRTPNEALLREHLDAENAHDLERIMATYAPSPVIRLNGTRIEGHDAIRAFHRDFGFGGDGGSFSEVRVDERARHATSQAIVLEQTLYARHTGTWREVPPTGRTVSLSVCTVYVFADDRLVEERVYLDEGRLLHALTRPIPRESP